MKLPDVAKKSLENLLLNILAILFYKPGTMNKQYIRLIADLKQNIVQSRCAAARLANKEQLLLYFRIGKIRSEKIAAEKWGAKILEQIAEDLQKQLPGLRGFSYRNLKNTRQFYAEYQSLTFIQSLTAELRKLRNSPAAESIELPDYFLNISFTHHILILNKCKSIEEYHGICHPLLVRFRCLVAFELKRGKFKPEYAGQLNFYLNVLDKKVKLKDENLKRLLHFHCLPRQQSPLPFLLLPYQQDRQIHLARLTSIIRNGR